MDTLVLDEVDDVLLDTLVVTEVDEVVVVGVDALELEEVEVEELEFKWNNIKLCNCKPIT